MTEITWQTKDLPREVVVRYFGMGVAKDGERYIAHVMAAHAQFGADARRRAAIHARCRATGAWDANERESHAMWLSLAALIEAGAV